VPNDKDGLKWSAKYASVGANALGLPILVDGLNEAGLAVGLFYFPTAAGYMPYTGS
jgi:choloylglycine hydrolase